METIGKKVWLVPDAYYPDKSVEGPYISHEAICLLNVGENDTEIEITLYFENAVPMAGFKAVCGAARTKHIRMDQIRNTDGQGVPKGVPYAILLKSSERVVCQYSRLDTTQMQMSLMTTIAYA